ncbi:hypothetical protein [Sorangium cellulosum]|uniref:hypothetical protein n=1 Tax=Sorangium TaxID=39643 RepID=UPI001F2AF57E|nr:hypothetical protein [Sorangium cellulosum]
MKTKSSPASRAGSTKAPRPAKRDGGAQNRRGSPDAVEKRRAARRFNELLLGGGGRAGDGRTERRRRRLLAELAEGVSRRGKRALKPIDVLSRVEELLELGEPLASIRKAYPPPPPVEVTAELVEGLRHLHRAYGFSADVYRFVGLDAHALRKAGVVRGGDREGTPDRRAGRDGAPRRSLTLPAGAGITRSDARENGEAPPRSGRDRGRVLGVDRPVAPR